MSRRPPRSGLVTILEPRQDARMAAVLVADRPDPARDRPAAADRIDPADRPGAAHPGDPLSAPDALPGAIWLPTTQAAVPGYPACCLRVLGGRVESRALRARRRRAALIHQARTLPVVSSANRQILTTTALVRPCGSVRANSEPGEAIEHLSARSKRPDPAQPVDRVLPRRPSNGHFRHDVHSPRDHGPGVTHTTDGFDDLRRRLPPSCPSVPWIGSLL